MRFIDSPIIGPEGVNLYLRRTRGSSFAPTDISGLKLWLKADAGAYVDAGSTLATNGQTIQQWNDQSGNGHHATQATAGFRPVYQTAIVNGLPVVRFNGTNQFLGFTDHADFTPSGGLTLIAVIAKSYTTGTHALYSHRATATNRVDLFVGSGTSTQNATYPTFMNYGGRADDTNSTSFQCYSFLFDDANDSISVYRNGSSIHSGSHATAMADISATPYLGSRQVDFLDYFGGDIAELLIYAGALSLTDRGSVETYLNGRYALY